MLKRVFILLLVLSISILIIIFKGTNLVAQPTYTVSDEPQIILNGELKLNTKELVINENDIYIALDIALDFLIEKMSLDILWDDKNKTVVMYDGENIIRVNPNSKQIRVNRNTVETDEQLLLVNNGQALLSTRLIEDYTNYKFEYIEDTNIIVIDELGVVKAEVKTKDTVRIRSRDSIWSEVKDIVTGGELLIVYKNLGDWTYVMSPRGMTGYIRNRDIKEKNKIIYPEKENAKVKNLEEKINLTWEYVNRKNPDVSKLSTIDGLNVISPTWFTLKNEQGDIHSKAKMEYVRWAHEHGYELWGLFGNRFDPDLTSIIINDSYLREKVINSLIDLALTYELDGINIDFENVYFKDRDMFTQFIKELYPIAKENNLVLSIDVTVKSTSENWSLFYDRKQIGKLVDYVILMAYDEHWAGGGVSGSVASLPWVERGVSTLLEEVSNYKVILGVPFYTRIWKEEEIDNEVKVTSFAVSMERAEELIEENKGTIFWDNEDKQFYGEYKKGRALYKVWLEEEKSMRERLNIIRKYNLSGIASWRKGFEKSEIWNVIKDELK